MFSDGFALIVYTVSAEEHRSKGIVGIERGGGGLGMEQQNNYFNTTPTWCTKLSDWFGDNCTYERGDKMLLNTKENIEEARTGKKRSIHGH